MNTTSTARIIGVAAILAERLRKSTLRISPARCGRCRAPSVAVASVNIPALHFERIVAGSRRQAGHALSQSTRERLIGGLDDRGIALDVVIDCDGVVVEELDV